MGIDRKYGKVTTEFGNIGADEPVVVFRAQDVTLPAVLLRAMHIAQGMGSPERHLKILQHTLDTIEYWQQENAEKVKVPTSESSKDRLEI